MRFLYIMDPLSRILPDKDTTFAFMRAGQKRGHAPLFCEVSDVFAKDGNVFAYVQEVKVLPASPWFETKPRHLVCLNDLDAVFVRKDPPFEASYLYLTHLLELARGKVRIVNDPRGLRDANEKLYALHFPHLMPRTLVSCNMHEIFEFVKELGGKAVIKPLDGAGGAGVMLLLQEDKNRKAIVEGLTHEGKRLAMVQAFLPEVTKGDKRILLLDGEILGAINRVAMSDDIRSNIHVGGSVEACEVTDAEKELVAQMIPRLKQDGLFFVGLDVIGGKLTEVNVTSPTGIQELSRHKSQDMAERVIEWAET